MVVICFAVYVLANNTQMYHILYRVRLNIWYNPCIIRQYIHGKTDEHHVYYSLNYSVLIQIYILGKQIYKFAM